MATLAPGNSRVYSLPGGSMTYSVEYLWDPNVLNAQGVTGGFRALQVADLAATNIISLTGSNFVINNIAITGTVATNPIPGATINVAVTGSPSVNAAITGSPTVTVGGIVTINSGSFAPTFGTVTAGQIQLPVGARSYSVAVLSGNAYINGQLLIAPIGVNGGGYDGHWTLNTPVNVGTTGGYITYAYES